MAAIRVKVRGNHRKLSIKAQNNRRQLIRRPALPQDLQSGQSRQVEHVEKHTPKPHHLKPVQVSV